MKLWPFSKKPVNSVSESHFELPPGVMLASPDEAGFEAQAAPTAGRYDAMHADEHATAPEQHEAPPASPVETRPDLPQFVEQNQLEFISQQPAEPFPQPPQQPADPHHAPATKAELYQEINESLTSLYDPETQKPEAPANQTKPEILPEQTLDELLAQPVPSPQNNIAHIDFGLPSKQENVNQDETLFDIDNSHEADIDLDAILYGPAANETEPASQLTASDMANLDFLAPPPVNSVEEPSATALYPPTATETNASEDMFYLPPEEPFGSLDSLEVEGQASELTSPLCDLSADLPAAAPVEDLFAADELQQMADFLGSDFLPQTEPLAALQDNYPAAADLPTAHFQDTAEEAAGHPQPESYTLAESGYQEPNVDFEADIPSRDEQSGMFSAMTLGNLDEFTIPDSLFQQAETISTDLPPTFTEEALMDTKAETYNQPEYAPDQAPETANEIGDSTYDFQASAEGFAEADYDIDDTNDGNDFDSYDLGHYDDPDHPAEAFVLSEDAPSETATADDMGDIESILHRHCEEPVTDLQAMARFLAAEAAETEPNEYTSADSLNEADADASSASGPASAEPATSSHNLSTHSLPAHPLPVAHKQPPAATTQGKQAAQPTPYQQEAAAIQPTQPAAIKANATPRQPQPYGPQPRRLYNDSVTEALKGFQEEMLLEDSRFLRNSINNLVDSYFSNQEPESSP